MTRPSRSRRGRPRLRLRDPRAPRRPAAGPVHRRARDADLPDDQLRVRGPGVGGRVLQPAGVRQHLLADHEPDRRGLRGAGRQPRGRRRRRSRSRAGIAAQAAALFTLLEPGDHVVVVAGALRRHGHPVQAPAAQAERRADLRRPRRPGRVARGRARRTRRRSSARRSATRAATSSTSRPSPTIAHEHELPLIVDNTFATPYLCRPIEWGADIVVHSATKFIGGHGTSIGGVVVEAGTFDWSNGRFPVVADPSPAYHGLQFHETFGMYGYLMKLRAETLRDLGAALSPFNAFLFLQGLETLPLRMERHVEQRAGGRGVPRGARAGVERDATRACPSSTYRPLVEKYLPRGAGAVFSFDCAGGRDGGQGLIDGAEAVVPPGQRRRREEPGHPPGQHDAPPAQRRGARGGRRRAGDDPALGRHRVGRRPDLGPRARLRASRSVGEGRRMTDLDAATRTR